MSSGIWANLPQTVKLYENETKAQILVSGLHSNNILIIRNSFDSFFIVKPNQRLYQIVFVNCVNCKLWVLDSAVVVTQRTVIIDCSNCQFLFEDVDIRKIELHRTINSEVVLIDSLPLIEYTNVYCLDSCKNISFTLGSIVPGMVFGMNYKTIKTVQVPDDRPSVINVDGLKGINIHKYPRKGQPIDLLSKEIHLEKVKEWENTKISLSPDDLSDAYDAERKEYEEEDKEIERKTEEVAKILKEKGNHVVCYTGAGISTSADIPDYRGPQGMWTLKEKGQYSSKSLEFDEVWPTYAHYAITLLAKRGIIHHIISTNLDGLHLRTGLPAHMITEQHGNIYKEVCYRCRTPYYRQYDTHEGYQDHKTDRYCDFCNYGLYDTIVNFAENLHEADQMTSLWHSRKSTVALVMGTSMNVQPAASYPLQALKNNGKLVIVNLQKTPFDDSSHVRIFTKTDKFMKVLLSKLGIDSKIDQSFDAKASW